MFGEGTRFKYEFRDHDFKKKSIRVVVEDYDSSKHLSEHTLGFELPVDQEYVNKTHIEAYNRAGVTELDAVPQKMVVDLVLELIERVEQFDELAVWEGVSSTVILIQVGSNRYSITININDRLDFDTKQYKLGDYTSLADLIEQQNVHRVGAGYEEMAFK